MQESQMKVAPASATRTLQATRPVETGAPTARPRLVFFYSRASGACRRADGFLAQVLQRRANHDTFVVHRVEETERRDLHEHFGIERVPTLVVIDGRRVMGRLVAPRGCAEIERFLAPWLR